MKDYTKGFTKKELHEVNKKLYGMMIEMIRSTVGDSMFNYIMSNPIPGKKLSKTYMHNMLGAVRIDMESYKEQITTCALKSFGDKVDYQKIASDLWKTSAELYLKAFEKSMAKKGKNGKARVCTRIKR